VFPGLVVINVRKEALRPAASYEFTNLLQFRNIWLAELATL
jgi:hypothetical protein